MTDEPTAVASRELARWALPGLLVLAGVVLYLVLAPRTAPVVSPAPDLEQTP